MNILNKSVTYNSLEEPSRRLLNPRKLFTEEEGNFLRYLEHLKNAYQGRGVKDLNELPEGEKENLRERILNMQKKLGVSFFES